MAQLKEILEREKQRVDDAQCRIIHLFPEGTEAKINEDVNENEDENYFW